MPTTVKESVRKARRFSDYPLTIYPLPVQWILTVVVPVAFAGFYPAQRLLDLDAIAHLAWLALPVGLIVLGIGVVVWHAGLDRYQSAGS